MNKFLSRPIKFLLLLFQLLALSYSMNSFAQSEKTGEDVSLINLIATPERFDGKTVYVTGYVSIAFENMSICLSKELSISTKNCLWLSIDSGTYDTDEDVADIIKESEYLNRFMVKQSLCEGLLMQKILAT